MHLLKFVVAGVQEIKLNNSFRLQSCKDYKMIRLNRTRSEGGGIAFIVQHTIHYREIPTNKNISDHQIIVVKAEPADMELYNACCLWVIS